MRIIEKYDEFSQKKKNIDSQIDSQKKQNKQKISGLKRQKLALKMNQLKKSMNKFVSGSSGFSRDNF